MIKKQHPTLQIKDYFDIHDGCINSTMHLKDRLKTVQQAVKTPYRQRCGTTLVDLSFSNQPLTLDDQLIRYLTHLIQYDCKLQGFGNYHDKKNKEIL